MLTPTPGWLAMRLSPCGHELALSLLGAGVMTDARRDDANVVHGFYKALGACSDPLHELRLVYEAMNEHAPYLLDAVAPLLTWAEHSSPLTEGTVRRAAEILAQVDFKGADEEALGDLLGQVRVELEIMQRRRRPEGIFYLELPIAVMNALADPNLPQGGEGIADFWCVSGVRVMGMIIAMQLRGDDPWDVTWHLSDPDPVNVAIAAINLASMGIEAATFEVKRGVMTPTGPHRMVRADDIESGKAQAYFAPEDMSGMDAMEAYHAAEMTMAPIIEAAEREAVASVIADALHGEGVGAAREAMRRRT